MCDQLLGEAALADAGLAGEQEQMSAATNRVVEAAEHLVQLRLATDEFPPVFLAQHRRRLDDRVQRRVLTEDRLLEVTQSLARLDPELLDEDATSVPVGLERLSLAPGAVEREHQLAPEALAQRVARNQGLEVPDDICAAEGELRLDGILERSRPEFVQPPDLRLRERLEAELRERRATP